MKSRNLLQEICDLRSVETPCDRCSGLGVKTYGSTATWKGGVGGQMLTSDVCDSCWGSGDSRKPWTDLRKVRSLWKAFQPDGIVHQLIEAAEHAIHALNEGGYTEEMAKVLKNHGDDVGEPITSKRKLEKASAKVKDFLKRVEKAR